MLHEQILSLRSDCSQRNYHPQEGREGISQLLSPVCRCALPGWQWVSWDSIYSLLSDNVSIDVTGLWIRLLIIQPPKTLLLL